MWLHAPTHAMTSLNKRTMVDPMTEKDTLATRY